MLTPSPTFQDYARDTCQVLAQIGDYNELLSDEWRDWLTAARTNAEQLGDDETGVLALRSARAAALIAATESAQAARFDARLLALTGDELEHLSDQLERQIGAALGERAISVAHLESMLDDLRAEARAQLAVDARSTPRHQQLVADDLTAIMRIFSDRIEAILLTLGEAARGAVGTTIGGLLPLRASHMPPPVDRRCLGDPDTPLSIDQLIEAVLAPYRAALIGQVDIVIRGLRSSLQRARRCRDDGDAAVRDQAQRLRTSAVELEHLAEQMDWLPVIGH